MGKSSDICKEVIQEKGKYETGVSYTDLCNIASMACDMHIKVSLAERQVNDE